MMLKNEPLKRRQVGIKRLGSKYQYIAVLSTEPGAFAVCGLDKIRVQEAFVHAIYHRKTGKEVLEARQPHWWKFRPSMTYKTGKLALPDDFDTSNEPCSSGIHFIPIDLPQEWFLIGLDDWMRSFKYASVGDMLALDRALWELENG